MADSNPADGASNTAAKTANDALPATTTILPTDTTHPSIPSLSVSDSAWRDQAELSKTSNNWLPWKERMIDVLTLSRGMHHYLDSTVPRPDPEKEPRATYNYTINDESVRAYIRTKIAREELSHVRLARTAHEMWSILRDRHERQGPVAQALLMEEALAIRYSRTIPFAETSSQIAALSDRIWDMGTPTRERFHAILHILALASPEMRSIHDAVTTDLVTATHDRPYSVQNILARLETEQKVAVLGRHAR